jgi:septal ring factor EnvC (AmiA/AmiB activator)
MSRQGVDKKINKGQLLTENRSGILYIRLELMPERLKELGKMLETPIDTDVMGKMIAEYRESMKTTYSKLDETYKEIIKSKDKLIESQEKQFSEERKTMKELQREIHRLKDEKIDFLNNIVAKRDEQIKQLEKKQKKWFS